MFNKLNQFIVSCSKSWWKFLLLVAGQTGTMFVLMNITQKFPSVTAGYEPFDMQNSLAAAEVFTQLESYTPEAFRLYSIFQAVDYLFPLFAGLVLATAGAFALRHASPSIYTRFANSKLLAWPLIPTVFDWLENINLLWAVSAWPERVDLAATLAVASKVCKLTSMYCVFAIVGILLVWATTRWLTRRLSPTDQA